MFFRDFLFNSLTFSVAIFLSWLSVVFDVKSNSILSTSRREDALSLDWFVFVCDAILIASHLWWIYRALGQGAFGEVYQGYLRHVAGDSVEMPVAVKVISNSYFLSILCCYQMSFSSHILGTCSTLLNVHQFK